MPMGLNHQLKTSQVCALRWRRCRTTMQQLAVASIIQAGRRNRVAFAGVGSDR